MAAPLSRFRDLAIYVVYQVPLTAKGPPVTDARRNGRHVVYHLHAHIVFVLKYPKKMMSATGDRGSALLVCRSLCEIRSHTRRLRDRQGHAHLLMSYPPKVALLKLVMSMKTISALRIRPHNWTEVTRALWGSLLAPSLCFDLSRWPVGDGEGVHQHPTVPESQVRISRKAIKLREDGERRPIDRLTRPHVRGLRSQFSQRLILTTH